MAKVTCGLPPAKMTFGDIDSKRGLNIRIGITDYPVPERIGSAPNLVASLSALTTPIGLPRCEIPQKLKQDIPRELWSIDRHLSQCLPR